MCDKHKPLTVYDSGGIQEYCEKCGKPLGKWKPNGNAKKHERKQKKVTK